MTTCKQNFVKGATNVYRTENYIVKQVFGIQLDNKLGNVTMSYDTYYLRTPELDAIYEYMFSDRKKIDGKRLHTTMYVRTYIE